MGQRERPVHVADRIVRTHCVAECPRFASVLWTLTWAEGARPGSTPIFVFRRGEIGGTTTRRPGDSRSPFDCPSRTLGLAQGRLSTALASLRFGRDDRFAVTICDRFRAANRLGVTTEREVAVLSATYLSSHIRHDVMFHAEHFAEVISRRLPARNAHEEHARPPEPSFLPPARSGGLAPLAHRTGRDRATEFRPTMPYPAGGGLR